MFKRVIFLKKLLAFLVLTVALFSFAACEDEEAVQEILPETPNAEEAPEELLYKEDLIGIWRVKTPFYESEIDEFAEELGISDFSTTAQMVTYIELKSDGTAGFVKDIDTLKKSAEECYFKLFYEAFTHARMTLSENDFYKAVSESYGYQSYQAFLKGEIPDRFKDSQSHKEFFKMAFEEVKKYENSPVEEQAAIGAIWAEILEEIGTNLVYENGAWLANTKYNYTWDFSEETWAFTFNETEYFFNGTYTAIHLTQKDNLENKMTWYRK